jgi:GxxExxY protein
MQNIYESNLSHVIIGSAIEVHRHLGPGLLESAYKECLSYELTKAGLFVIKERSLPVVYKEVKLDYGYRIDLLVENKIVVEVKSVDALHDVHAAQVLTYLRLGNYKLGMLLNFNTTILTQGIKRVIL